MEAIATKLPYITGIGCHERDNRYDWHTDVSYAQYLNRFSGIIDMQIASQSPLQRFYSFNFQYVHFISIDTDPWLYMAFSVVFCFFFS